MALGHPGDHQLILGHILGDGGTCPQGSTLADTHRRYQLGIGTDEHIILDDGLELVHAVVIAGDGTGTDIHFGTHLGIPPDR